MMWLRVRKEGCHAHKSIEDVIICLKGSCTCLLDDGENRDEILLANPQKGLYIKKRIWLEIYNFSSDCILMILSDSYYNELDYIRDYENFLNLRRQNSENG